MNKNKVFMIVSIITLVVAIIGATGTYAWYVWGTGDDDVTKIVTGVGAATIYFDAGSSMTGVGLKPVKSYTSGLSKTIIVGTSDNISNITFNLYLDISTLDEGLKHSSFKYSLYQGSVLRTEGNFSDEYLNNVLVTCESNNTNHIVLLEDEQITTSLSDYVLYIWIDGMEENPNTMQNQNFSFKLHADGQNAVIREALMTTDATIEGSLAYKIVNDYIEGEKSGVTNNNIRYYYDIEHQLMADIDGNVRYYGADPNNYIFFNCSDYTNQSTSTCERWRIIGVFGDKVKIIRRANIGGFSWDNKTNSIGSSLDPYGSNDWTDSRLMMLLNPGYEDGVTGSDGDVIYGYEGSLYWNGRSGTCYAGSSNATKSCNFTSIGLKNDATRNLIAETIWDLSGQSSTAFFPDDMYELERIDFAYQGRPTRWKGKIGLAYASDYGYAADFNSCKSMLRYYNDQTCTSVNWLKTTLGGTSGNGWLLNPNSNVSRTVRLVFSDGHVDGYYAYNSYNVTPVLYLNAELGIQLDGDGTLTNPYKLSV